MVIARLTKCPFGAIRHNMRKLILSGGAVSLLMMVTSCVQVKAPDKPIVINLNINIKQEVVYRLNDDAKSLINKEAEIF